MRGQQVPKGTNWAPPGNPGLGGVVSVIRLVLSPRNLLEIPRLLSEGPGPLVRLCIQIHNTAEIARLLRKGWQVSFVSSFPRSGNTWVRHLLSDVFLQNRGVETTTKLPVHPDKIVPDFYSNWIGRRDLNIPTPGVFIKTHDVFEQLEARFGKAKRVGGPDGRPGLSPIRRCKQIYLYRSPEDSLTSLYHHHVGFKEMKRKTAGGIDAFCLAELGAWEAGLASYLKAADEGVPVLFVPYELLLQYPGEILGNLLRWVGAKHDTTTVEKAVSNMEFSKLQAVEKSGAFNEEALFFRKGCKGSGRTELQPETLAVIQDRTSHLLEQAHSRVMVQQSLQRTPASTKTGQIRIAAALQNKQSKGLKPLSNLQVI